MMLQRQKSKVHDDADDSSSRVPSIHLYREVGVFG